MYDNICLVMVKSDFKASKSLLFKTQNTILSAAFILAVMYGVSAVLSLIRTRILAHYFGADEVLGIFYTADRIPSFVFTLLISGTLSSIFIPIFTSLYKEDSWGAWKTTSNIISIVVLLFLALGAIAFVFAPTLITIISVGQFDTSQIALGANLMRIMLFAQLLLIFSSFVSSILQSLRIFFVTALAPIAYNLGMILGIVFLVSKYGIYAPAIGVVIGAGLHLLVQVPVLFSSGFKYEFTIDFKDSSLIEIIKLLPPRVFNAIIAQSSLFINNALAILVSTSSVVILRFADQLQNFPVQFFGASIALAALPTLSYENTDNKERFKETFIVSFHQMMFLVIPASVILLVLRVPVVRLVFGAERFPWEATIQTSYALAFYAIGIFAQSAVLLISRAFYALKDTFTPVKSSLVGLFVGVVSAILFITVFEFGVWSVALGFTLGVFVDFIVAISLLGIKLGGFDFTKLTVPFLKISYSALFMGLSLYIPMKVLDIYILDTTRTINLILLTAIASFAGCISYLFFTKILRVKEIELFYKVLSKLNFTKATIAESKNEI